MSSRMELFLFGDQTFDVSPQLASLLNARDDLIVGAFLPRAYNAIRNEIYRLSSTVREELPRFTNIEDIVRWKQSGAGPRCIPLDMAVTTLWQLAQYMLHPAAFPCDGEDARVYGICTGAFAAAAISCSQNARDAIPLAVDAVVASFRTGMVVEDVRRKVTTAPDDTQEEHSWSVLVGGKSAAAGLETFDKQSRVPLHRRPYTSAYAPSGCTVSGPPDALRQLLSSAAFQQLSTRPVPIFGLYHAAHLYSQDDVAAITSGLGSDAAGKKPETISLLLGGSTSSEARNFAGLLNDAVAAVLLHPIRWDAILEGLHASLREVAPQEFNVLPFGTAAHHLIYDWLRTADLPSLRQPQQPVSPLVISKPERGGTHGKPPLAIVGMSGRFPEAQDTEAFWNILYHGYDVHRHVPPQHWDPSTHVDTSSKPRKNTSATPFGCWLKDPQDFDARFFNISPKEAPQIDPAQRMALMTAYEAIEQAGIVPDATPSTRPDRVGVFYGVTSNDWMETNSSQDIDTYMIPGGNRAFIPGRINYFFKFSGPSYAVDTACSSSLAGIHVACNSLWRGDIDTAIAGGTNVLTNPDFTAGLDRGHFLSRSGNCKTFDDGADGYCRGEGIATIIMKRLDDALADKDPVLAVVKGAYTNHSAESESITRPHVGAQRSIFNKILNEAVVDPNRVSYIEMHGTGTQAGDAAEMSSVLDAFAPTSSGKRARSEKQPLYLGSAKANIGHGEAASGASSIIKVLMMMAKDTIVPHCGIKTAINHRFPSDLDARNVHIAQKPVAWSRNGEPRRAFVNNFSAAGGNSAVLLEDAPPRSTLADSSADSRGLYPVAVSARTPAALQGNLASLVDHLRGVRDLDLGELSYTTTARRTHHPFRILLTGQSIEDIAAKAEKAVQDKTGGTRAKGTPKVVFAFTGQGAQHTGMARQLLEECSTFRAEINRLDRLVTSLAFPSFLPVITSQDQEVQSFRPLVVQLASVCIQIALVTLWSSLNIRPSAVVGHSLGEYAALNAAGVLSVTDTIFLVGRRAQLLEQQCAAGTHTMLVVSGPEDKIRQVLQGREYEIACVNSPCETVLAGQNGDIQALRASLSPAGMQSTVLRVPYAFHSSQIEAILPDLESCASVITFPQPRVPVLRPLDGKIVTKADFDANYLARHSREPVNMLGALRNAQREGLITDRSIILEIGPHPVVSRMAASTLTCRVPTIASLRRAAAPCDVLCASLKVLYDNGAQLDWAAYQKDFPATHIVMPLPAYAWDLKPYWIQYQNDWSLHKGEQAAGDSPRSSRLESTTIHTVVEESGNADETKIVLESDISRKDLKPLVQGHEVDGIPLCTPSVYADIALTLGDYLLKRFRPDQLQCHVDVADMTISKALILNAQEQKQLIQAQAEVDWHSQAAATKFMSFDSKGALQEHARCVIRFRDRSRQKEAEALAAGTTEKIRSLREGIVSGATARFNRPMVYRAIRPLARFHDDYRAIDEIVLNSHTLEASSRLSFGSVKREGTFHTHPAIIDALSQVCGFAMNCNDHTDLDTEVFMNHGWGSLQLFEKMDFEKVYTTYTRMVAHPDKLWRGDVLIMHGEIVVARFGEVAIQGVPRRVLKVVLSLESGRKSQPTASVQPLTRAAAMDDISKQAPKAGRQKAPSVIEKALQIISEESGIAADSLTDSTEFNDVGIDSLLGLTISARFREELDVDSDFNAIFYEHPTVKDLKAFFSQASAEDDRTDSAKVEAAPGAPAAETPRPSPPGHFANGHAPSGGFRAALQIISEESGVAMDDLGDDANLADCGVDSLMSLVIASRLRDELAVDVDSQALFLELPTVGDLKTLIPDESEEPLNSPSTGADNDVVLRADDMHGATGMTNGFEHESCDAIIDGDHEANDVGTVNGHHRELANGVHDSLQKREQAVSELVEKYAAGFAPPTSDSTAPISDHTAKVVLVTGASGSLGGHLAYHLAQLDEVKTVVCLNRMSKEDATTRQYKAMRDKGIRFPEALRLKLIVLETDMAKARLGLSQIRYDDLATSVTHVIHQAWPMNAKRALAGFESQFQVMRNLIDFVRDAASHQPAKCRVGFQLVSSIGVVGLYGQHKPVKRVVVPEQRASIDSVLSNGYSEAKWGCERMLDATLHRSPDRFRVMVARLGQIAGSKTSGYWNPMEHFGFLVKSSQTLDALPDVEGQLYWTPVSDVAATLADLSLADGAAHAVYHVDNPAGQSWAEMNGWLQDAVGIANRVPFREWLERVRQAPQRDNPATLLLDFLDDNYLRMSCGGLVLDVAHTLEHSKTLRAVGKVEEKTVRKYVHIWKEIGFLKTTQDDRDRFEEERKRLWG